MQDVHDWLRRFIARVLSDSQDQWTYARVVTRFNEDQQHSSSWQWRACTDVYDEDLVVEMFLEAVSMMYVNEP